LTDEYQEVEDGDQFYTYTRSMKQELELRAGGKPDPGREDLVIFNVSASEHDYLFNNDVNLPFFSTNLGTIAASAINLWGQVPDANGTIPALVVPSSITRVTPLIFAQNKSATVSAPQAKLQIMSGPYDLTGKTTSTWIEKG